MSWYRGVVLVVVGIVPFELNGLMAVAQQLAFTSDPTPFTEEAIERGIVNYITGSLSGGFGVAFADFNNNGHADLLACGDETGLIGVWSNNGDGIFAEMSV